MSAETIVIVGLLVVIVLLIIASMIEADHRRRYQVALEEARKHLDAMQWSCVMRAYRHALDADHAPRG